MADSTEFDETQDEREIVEDTDATPDEAHRIGEFDDLRDMMASIRDEISGLRSTIADMITSSPGDVATDSDNVPDDDERDLIDIDDLDL